MKMEFDPTAMVNTETEDGLGDRSVNGFISSLKSSFQAPDFDKMEEYLVLRERSMKREEEEFGAKTKKESDALRAELVIKTIENQFLDGKQTEEVSGRLTLEAELHESKRECEHLKEKVTRLREDHKVMCDREKREASGRLALQAKLNERERECEHLKENVTRLREDHKVMCDREKKEVSGRLALQAELNERERECEYLKENVTRLREDYRVMCDREKRGEERYARLLEELKRNEECIAQLSCRNKELECEKRLTEEIWKKRFGELGSRVMALETDTEMLKRMKSDSRVRTACFPESSAAQEAARVIKIKEVMDLGSTSGNYVEKYHATPGSGTSCHTPPEGIPSWQGRGGRVPASVDIIDISSDHDDETPGAMRMDSTEPGSNEKKFKFLDEIGTQDKLQSKQECLTHAGPEDAPKRKEASSSTQIPMFLKRFRGKFNAESAFDTSSDDSSDSGSDDLDIDEIMSSLKSKQKA